MDGIHEGHRARMKKKLLENGERSLADHELLEVLLYYAIPRRDTNELAHRLLKQFGSLRGVLSAPVQELACVSGVGQQAALLLGMVPMLCRRAAQREKEQILNSVDACGAYFTELLGSSRREMLWQVCLDGKGKVLSSRCLAEGDVSMAAGGGQENLCRFMQAWFGSSGRDAPMERHKYRGGRADVGIGPYETMKRNAAHKTADADRHDR